MATEMVLHVSLQPRPPLLAKREREREREGERERGRERERERGRERERVWEGAGA